MRGNASVSETGNMKAGVIFLYLIILCAFSPNAAAQEVLSWQDCIAEAQKNNPELISAEAAVDGQKAGRSIAASDLFPQIDASADVSRAKTTTKSATTGRRSSTIANSDSYGVSGTQLVFDGFKTINDMNEASANIKAARQSYRFTSADVRLNLRTAFVNLLKAQELILVAEEILKIRKDNLALITLRYQSGLEHRGALLTAEANLAQAEFELAQAKRDITVAQRRLTKEMGREEFRPLEAKGDFTVRDAAIEKPDFEGLAERHPSYLRLAAETDAATFGVKSAYADFVPQVSGTADASRTGKHWPPKNEQWNLGLSFTMPVFDGGLRLAQLSQAKAVYEQARADQRSSRDTIIVNLEESWAALQDAMETVDVQRKSLTATEERSSIAAAQYSTGFIAFDNWIIIENDFVSAKKGYLKARTDALLTEANWIQAKGEALEYAE